VHGVDFRGGGGGGGAPPPPPPPPYAHVFSRQRNSDHADKEKGSRVGWPGPFYLNNSTIIVRNAAATHIEHQVSIDPQELHGAFLDW
jgi:hypothetical protein